MSTKSINILYKILCCALYSLIFVYSITKNNITQTLSNLDEWSNKRKWNKERTHNM